MKLALICILLAGVFAAPCVYDITSKEPSPLNGLVALSASTPLQGDAPAPPEHSKL
ncbi:hypothetical protein JNB88_32110 [Rhizobium cauense]|uniref:hypothetical protein n=1 Tax=Rhizobium cauense TaxID=1166683 RepID=UPI001C6E8366|nr:hypothetical protein [Rhizobium cauense]MBW9118253.1 hypothetical protein [Rhizobium cauense]